MDDGHDPRRRTDAPDEAPRLAVSDYFLELGERGWEERRSVPGVVWAALGLLVMLGFAVVVWVAAPR
jgi:hypothetical protein